MMEYARIEAAVSAYEKTATPFDLMRLRLFSALWGIMARTEARSADAAKAFADAVDAEELRADAAQGIPFMANHPIPVDGESLADVVELLVSCVADAKVYQADVNTALTSLNIRQLIYVSDLDLASVDPERYLNSLVEAMRGFGIDGATITILTGLVSLGLRALLEPAADALMTAVGAQAVADAASRNCPVCGGRPSLAVLAERKHPQSSGRRLACLQCGTTWSWDRFACPHCGNGDFTTLGYRTLKGDEAHRVDYCKECGNYIRTAIIPTEFHPVSIDVEDCMMAQLDAFAAEGAQTSTPPAASASTRGA